MPRKVALITGAGTGIGKAAAVALAAAEFAIVLAGRRSEPLEAVAAEVARLGGDAIAVPTDVSQPDSVSALFSRIDKSLGRLDLLFNNAGGRAPAIPFEDLTYAQWRAVIDGNLTGAFLCTQQAFVRFKSQTPMGGRVINNGSVSAHTPRPLSAPYTASKHAITGLTRSTALDGRPFDIAVGQIDIGNAATDLTTRMVAEGALQADGSMATEPRIDVEEVGRAVAYMASLPLSANVLFMTVMATRMPFVGRG